jgi:hypothetical protein
MYKVLRLYNVKFCRVMWGNKKEVVKVPKL